MQVENSEVVIKKLFQKTMDRFELTTVNTKGILQALRSVLPSSEFHRLFFILDNLPQGELPKDKQLILKNYQAELMDKLVKEHLFLARDKELQIIRRPIMMLTYTYIGKICLAISERELVLGENGRLIKVELGNFQYLPKPNRGTAVGAALKAWGVDVPQVDEFIQKNLIEKEHIDQVDVFYDNRFNLLKYDADGRFINALPVASPYKLTVVAKGRVSTSGPAIVDNISIVDDKEIDDESDL